MLEETRRKIAGFFGRIEHRFGRLMGVAIAITGLMIYYEAPQPFPLWGIIVSFVGQFILYHNFRKEILWKNRI